MSLRLVVASLFVTATAFAQAPGEVQPVAPAAAPVVENPCGGCFVPVMANRWAVGLSIGSMSLAPRDTPDDQTHFAIGELAVRFRATPHLELELSVGGGREQTDNGMDGTHEVSTATLGLRYRFMAEHRWNWYLMAGLGGTAVTLRDATDQEKKDANRGQVSFGAGLERRFDHFALQAELRFVSQFADDNSASTTPVVGTVMPVGDPPPSTATPSTTYRGGQLTIGASYYF
jgi:opacity protein-like surface antigen